MMNTRLVFIACLLSGMSTTLSAQHTRFISSGTIAYERSTNMYAILQKKATGENTFMQQIIDQFKKTQPQFLRSKSTLYFSKGKTLFKPVQDETPPPAFFGEDPETSQINIIYTDLNTHQQITQKKVYEQTYLIKDTARTINWKITDETREIAGYSCRRANALVLDSIYVVAFYTDEIPVSSGPESFNGLPGMILGVALPHENVTWFAQKVTDKVIEDNLITPPVKGKATDNRGFLAAITSALKNWGEYAKAAFKAFQL